MDEDKENEKVPEKPTFEPKVGIRTYASDMADAVAEDGGSVIKVAMAEHKRRSQELETKKETSRAKVIFIPASIVLLLGATALVFYIKFWQAKENEVIINQSVQSAINSLVRADFE